MGVPHRLVVLIVTVGLRAALFDRAETLQAAQPPMRLSAEPPTWSSASGAPRSVGTRSSSTAMRSTARERSPSREASRAQELLAGLRAIAEGGAPLTPAVAKRVLDLMRNLGRASFDSHAPTKLDLTEREQQVLRCLVEGLSYKQVGDALGIGLGTVRTHVTGVYRKLQVHSVGEAIGRAVRERLV